MENYCREAERNWNGFWPRITAVTRNCWFFLASTFFSRINSILADTTQFAGFTTSRGRETLPDIYKDERQFKNLMQQILILRFVVIWRINFHDYVLRNAS